MAAKGALYVRLRRLQTGLGSSQATEAGRSPHHFLPPHDRSSLCAAASPLTPMLSMVSEPSLIAPPVRTQVPSAVLLQALHGMRSMSPGQSVHLPNLLVGASGSDHGGKRDHCCDDELHHRCSCIVASTGLPQDRLL